MLAYHAPVMHNRASRWWWETAYQNAPTLPNPVNDANDSAARSVGLT